MTHGWYVDTVRQQLKGLKKLTMAEMNQKLKKETALLMEADVRSVVTVTAKGRNARDVVSRIVTTVEAWGLIFSPGRGADILGPVAENR